MSARTLGPPLVARCARTSGWRRCVAKIRWIKNLALTRPRRRRGEFQRHAVHAVAQPGRLRTVGEDVAEMAAAAMARYGGAGHAERAVLALVDRVLQRRPETRPAGAALEFGLGREQRQIAAGAAESTVAMLVEQRAGERPLGAFAAQHVKLFRRQ